MSASSLDLRLCEAAAQTETYERRGRVVEALGAVVKASGLRAQIGQSCEIRDRAGGVVLPAEVVGLRDGLALLTPLAPLHGLSADAEVVLGPPRAEVLFGEALLGRILDARGAPLDGLGPLPHGLESRPLYAAAPDPMTRTPIDQLFATGVRVLDSMLSVGAGQRVGVFSQAGVGKSTFLAMLGRNSGADVNVVALVGERGREVREFVDQVLGAEGLRRSVVVVATSDRPAMERVRAANAATAIAEGFRAQGRNVLLLMDSITRYARALREVGLAAGEPAVRRGFPTSVFAELPRLFERAGAADGGAITAFYSVLVEDEDNDPIGEEVRSILDGHIWLSRTLSEAGRFPPVDLPRSVSRLFPALATAGQQAAAARVRGWLAKYAEIEFLLQIGEYQAGGDPAADEAVAHHPALEAFLRQDRGACTAVDAVGQLIELAQ